MSGALSFGHLIAQKRNALFWAGAVALILVKLALVSDLSVQMEYFPHDDSLYVDRAYYLLHGEGFGPYDSRTLLKYPGLSFWLAATRSLGIPYILSLQVLYALAGLYLVFGLVRSGSSTWIALLGFALYLFNPITFGAWWTRVLREPLSTGLFVLILGAWLHFLSSIEQGRPRIGHGILAGIVFGFALYVREEDRLLWVLLFMAVVLLAWRALSPGASFSRKKACALVAGVISAHIAAGWCVDYAARRFIENFYGLPIIQDFSEGEFPRLMAAIRSIRSDKDNRMVMATQDALRRLRTEVPAFAPVVERLPPPGPRTLSCQLHGVCSEWSNGWMLYWIKDAAYAAGLTPDLPTAQKYFRSVRESIEQACALGHFSCERAGEGLIPPLELRWTRAYVAEWLALLKLAIRPDPVITLHPPVRFPVRADLGRRYQAVTMTDYFDTEWQTAFVQVPNERPYVNAFAGWRVVIGRIYAALAPFLVIGLVGGTLIRAAGQSRIDSGFAVCALATAFLLFRLFVLAYIAVFMGTFDSRMVLTTYSVATLLALPLLAGTFPARRSKDVVHKPG